MAILLLAALLTGIDILLSMELGLLANPPLLDGLGYTIDARLGPGQASPTGVDMLEEPYWELSQVASPVLEAVPSLTPLSRRAPIWSAMIVLSDRVFGVGAWQPYTVRFWPIALLLLVMFVEVRRHGNTWIAWAAVLVTSMLPIVSVSIRSATYERYVSHTVDFGREWFIADLRPDYAASAALVALAVCYFRWIERPTRWRAGSIGVVFALACLMKSSVSPASLFVLGMMGAYTLIAQRRMLLQHLGKALLAAAVALLLLLPWAIAGGMSAALDHILVNTNELASFWSSRGVGPVAIVPRALRYVEFIDSLLGSEFWIVIGFGLVLAITFWGRKIGKQSTLDGYIFVGVASLLPVITLSNLMRPIGAGASLILWLAAWCLIARETARVFNHFKISQAPIPMLAGAYCVGLTAAGYVAYTTWPAYGREVGRTNGQVSATLVHDIERNSREHDTVAMLDTWGFPVSVAHDLGFTRRMLLSTGLFARARGGMTPAEVADDVLRACAACSVVVTLDADSVDDAPHQNAPLPARPYQDAVARWVKDATSPYVLARAYPITADPFTSLNTDEDGRYAPSLLLFVREDGRMLPDRGFNGPRDGILFGDGWYKAESQDAERFRWAHDEIELVLSPTGQRTLTLDIEPGPDLAGGPLDLSVIADDGTSTRLPPIASRRTVTFEAPGLPDSKRSVRLRSESPDPQRGIGGRVLTFRAFDAVWGGNSTVYGPELLLRLNASNDIGPADLRQTMVTTGSVPADGLFVGYGWYPAEQASGAAFRWAANDTEIVVTRPTGRYQALDIEVEPGPGVGARPFELDVVDGSDEVVATASVQGRAIVRVPLPIRPADEAQRFRLHVREGGLTVPGDRRLLNFRVFSLRWATR